MEAYLQDLITQSLAFTLMVVLLVAFLESLALVGLLLPGTVMMASIGALIGSGKVDFYYAGGGDRRLPARRLDLLFRRPRLQRALAPLVVPEEEQSAARQNRTRLAPAQHGDRSDRPLRWPDAPAGADGGRHARSAAVQVCFAEHHRLPDRRRSIFPRHPAGVAIDIPAGANSAMFKWLLLAALTLWLAVWLSWRWWREGKRNADRLSRWLTPLRLRVVCAVSWPAALAVGYLLSQQPLMPVYRHLLWQVLSGQSS